MNLSTAIRNMISRCGTIQMTMFLVEVVAGHPNIPSNGGATGRTCIIEPDPDGPIVKIHLGTYNDWFIDFALRHKIKVVRLDVEGGWARYQCSIPKS